MNLCLPYLTYLIPDFLDDCFDFILVFLGHGLYQFAQLVAALVDLLVPLSLGALPGDVHLVRVGDRREQVLLGFALAHCFRVDVGKLDGKTVYVGYTVLADGRERDSPVDLAGCKQSGH